MHYSDQRGVLVGHAHGMLQDGFMIIGLENNRECSFPFLDEAALCCDKKTAPKSTSDVAADLVR
jgi:hypothetical protein